MIRKVLLAFAVSIGGLSQPATAQTVNTFCDVGPDAMSDSSGLNIPRTCLTWKSWERCFYTFIPDCASGPTPLVFDIHGSAVCPSFHYTYSKWLQKAQEECFVVVWPTGNTDANVFPNSCFSSPGGATDPDYPDFRARGCCCGTDPSVTDDLALFRRIGRLVAEQVPVDTNGEAFIDGKRIYMSGHSNGCIASLAMAMQHSDFVAAVGCMAGDLGAPAAPDYSPRPIWVVAGQKDIVIPYDGSAMSMSFPAAHRALSDINGCTTESEEEVAVPDMDLALMGSPGTMKIQTSTGCQNGATVQYISLSNSGHFPYGGAVEITPPFPLAATTSVDTTRMAWDFASSFALDQDPIEFRDLLTNGAQTTAPVESTKTPTALTAAPTAAPTKAPTRRPSPFPTLNPTMLPTTIAPTGPPSLAPTRRPTSRPTPMPTPSATPAPAITTAFTSTPFAVPTKMPSTVVSLGVPSPTSIPSTPPSPSAPSSFTSTPFAWPKRSDTDRESTPHEVNIFVRKRDDSSRHQYHLRYIPT